MLHVVREEVGNRRERRARGLPPDSLANFPNTVSDDILVPIIQHKFVQHAYNSLSLNRGTEISCISPTNQNIQKNKTKIDKGTLKLTKTK